MRKMLVIVAACTAVCMALVGCGSNAALSASASSQQPQASSPAASGSAEASQGIDYLALVNKLNPLPAGWEDALETVHFTNSVGDDVEVEKTAYEAYLELKADLEKEGVYVDLDSARRSVAEQQRIMDEFTAKYGADYAKKTVATPGYSEHHTGLALDLYLIVDGKDITENEDMVRYPEIWSKIHAKLAAHGFILRYLNGDEHITGYGYEPWHIRFIGSPAIAKEITDQGITFEEYKAGKTAPEVLYDYGNSSLYTRADLEEAAVQVKCEFAMFADCELHSLRYAGDEFNTKENLDWLNGMDESANYTQVAKFLSDYHSPVQGGGAWEPDKEYTDHEWWLVRADGEGWQLVTYGY